MRTYQDLADRLDAMTLVRSPSSRANLIKCYLMRAVEADEKALGLNGKVHVPVPDEPPGDFRTLSAPVRNAVLEVYARLKKRKPKGAAQQAQARATASAKRSKD